MRGGRRVSLRRAGIGQLREARPGLDLGIRAPGAACSGAIVSAPRNIVSTQAAGVQQPVGEDVAAIRVGAELDFVDRDELARRGRAAWPPRCRRTSRASGGTIFSSPVISATYRAPLRGDHPVVIFSREQPQRKADHAGGVGQHPLHREMRLAGIGRT